MRNNMQTSKGEEGYIWPLGAINLQGTVIQQSQRGKRGKKITRVEPGISRRGKTGREEKEVIHTVYGP